MPSRTPRLASLLAILTLALVPAPVEAAKVQSGTATIADGNTSTTATITAVDLGTTFLIFSLTGSDANPNNLQVSGQITDTTTLTFTRIGTSSAVSINWYVAEFTSGATVQRGTLTPMTGTTHNVPIASVDPAKAVPIISYAKAGSGFGDNDFVKAKLTSATNLELTRVGGSDGAVEWQVVEFTNAAVQTGDVAFGAGDASKTDTLTAVDTAKSWLVYSYSSASGTAADIGQKLVRGVITNTTTLTFDRDNTGQAIDLTWYLVEFTDATTVQHASEPFGAGETQRDVTITAVDLAQTFAAGGLWGRGGKSPYSADDDPGVGWFTGGLTATTNLQLTRALTGSTTADVGWFVVQLANEPPTVSDISNQATIVDTPTGAIAFTVGDLETAPASLTVAGTSDDQTLVPDANIVFGGSGASRTVTITPAAGQEGSATITVTVSDGTQTATDTFDLTVGPANGAPTISAIPNMSIRRWDTTDPVPFVITDAETPAASLIVSGSSSNQGLVRDADIVFGGTGANRTFEITPVGNTGDGTITITVSDGTNDTTRTFQLIVNEPPTVTSIADQVTDEDVPTDAIPFTVGDVESAATDLIVTGGSYNLDLVADAGVVIGGSGASRTVTVTPLPDASGSATIWVLVEDGTEHVVETFELTIIDVNDPPTLTSIADQTVNEDTPTEALAFTVDDDETEAVDLTVTASSSNQAIVPDANIVLSGTGEERAVVVTPAQNQGGDVTIALTVSDGTLTSTGTFQLTVIPDMDVIISLTGNGTGGIGSTPAGISCGTACTAEFPNGTVVTLSAQAGAGSVFAGWVGPEDCLDGVLTEVGNAACSARFTLQTVTAKSDEVDFNGDDRSDVFWYHADTGAWGVEMADVAGFSSIRGTWLPGETVIPLDLDGNGLTDLFRYNAATGAWVQQVNLGNGTFAAYPGAWLPGWGILGMEINGDGRSDLFRYNGSTGQWSACATGATAAQFECRGGPYSTGWKITRLSLNLDALDDLFIHQPSTGHWFRYVNDGAGGLLQQGGAPLRGGQVMASAWLRSDAWTLHPADLDANGVSDLLFYRPDTGLWAEGMNTADTFSFYGGQWHAGWSVATGELGGDAAEDALLYNPETGLVMEAANVGLGFQLAEAAAWTADWQLHPTSFNGDHLLDVLLYNETTGQWFAAVRQEAGGFAYQTGAWPVGVQVTTELPADLR